MYCHRLNVQTEQNLRKLQATAQTRVLIYPIMPYTATSQHSKYSKILRTEIQLSFYIPLDTKSFWRRSLAWYRKAKPNTTKAHMHQPKECTTRHNKHKKPKVRFSHIYDIRPGTERAYSGFGSS